MERNEGGATIGTLFQHIVNDMKVSGPAYLFFDLHWFINSKNWGWICTKKLLSKQKLKDIFMWLLLNYYASVLFVKGDGTSIISFLSVIPNLSCSGHELMLWYLFIKTEQAPDSFVHGTIWLPTFQNGVTVFWNGSFFPSNKTYFIALM